MICDYENMYPFRVIVCLCVCACTVCECVVYLNCVPIEEITFIRFVCMVALLDFMFRLKDILNLIIT